MTELFYIVAIGVVSWTLLFFLVKMFIKGLFAARKVITGKDITEA